jgi:hypothetical protein
MSMWGAAREAVVDTAGAAVGAVPALEPVAAGIHVVDGAAYELEGGIRAAMGDNEGAAHNFAHGATAGGAALTSLIPLAGAMIDAGTAGWNWGATIDRATGAEDENSPTIGNLVHHGMESAMSW